MVDIDSLMIGNYINFVDYGTKEVKEIDAYAFVDWDLNSSSYEHIPITEKWLIDLGGVDMYDNRDFKYFDIGEDEFISVNQFIKDEYYYQIGAKNIWTSPRNLNSINHLQNLYFSYKSEQLKYGKHL